MIRYSRLLLWSHGVQFQEGPPIPKDFYCQGFLSTYLFSTAFTILGGWRGWGAGLGEAGLGGHFRSFNHRDNIPPLSSSIGGRYSCLYMCTCTCVHEAEGCEGAVAVGWNAPYWDIR